MVELVCFNVFTLFQVFMYLIFAFCVSSNINSINSISKFEATISLFFTRDRVISSLFFSQTFKNVKSDKFVDVEVICIFKLTYLSFSVQIFNDVRRDLL